MVSERDKCSCLLAPLQFTTVIEHADKAIKAHKKKEAFQRISSASKIISKMPEDCLMDIVDQIVPDIRAVLNDSKKQVAKGKWKKAREFTDQAVAILETALVECSKGRPF